MNKLMALFVFFLGLAESAKANPSCTIEFASVTDRLGVVSGTAQASSDKPVFVTIENGGLSYTTIVDTKGNWAKTFRYFSSSLSAFVWQEGVAPLECQDNFGIRKKLIE